MALAEWWWDWCSQCLSPQWLIHVAMRLRSDIENCWSEEHKHSLQSLLRLQRWLDDNILFSDPGAESLWWLWSHFGCNLLIFFCSSDVRQSLKTFGRNLCFLWLKLSLNMNFLHLHSVRPSLQNTMRGLQATAAWDIMLNDFLPRNVNSWEVFGDHTGQSAPGN